MAQFSRTSVFEKLNTTCYKSIESATSYCKLRQNPEIEMAHWLSKLLQLQDSDIHHMIKAYELSEPKISADINTYIDSLPTTHQAALDFSWIIEDTIEKAWLLTSLYFNESTIRSGHLICAMLDSKPLRAQLVAISEEFKKLTWSMVSQNINKAIERSPEAQQKSQSPQPGVATSQRMGGEGSQEILDKYTVNVTQQARDGEIDSIVGRDQEIRQVIDILMRRRQNNPILTGEAGVGKTAIVEGLAHKIASGDVPPMIEDTSILLLDMGLLQAGASMKGEFEERLKQIIDAVQGSDKPIIMFIDETHTLIGAGGNAGTSDAANLLKPALARGTLRTIGATTWSEYKKHIEKDPALSRRFQPVPVDEPNEEKAVAMLRHIVPVMEKHHGVIVRDESILSAVQLSSRYIPARQLPDKAVSLIDTACARVSLTQHSTPAEIDDIKKKIINLETEMNSLTKEDVLGFSCDEQRADIKTQIEENEKTLSSLNQLWDKEKELVSSLNETRTRLLNEELGDEEKAALTKQIKESQSELSEIQNKSPLILPEVNEQAIATVVQDWTGIPVSRMQGDEIQATLTLKDKLVERIIGQDNALEMITKQVKTSRAGLENPNKPVGVFLLVGPSGTGKTETALALADQLYGGEQNLITINMSEFQESHTVSSLKGAPPGYVGYGEGGVLTEAVRRRPYSVILLDEIEKAHPDVHEIFFQVFDKGVMEDGEGTTIDFKNNLILLTSNVGSHLIHDLYKDESSTPSYKELITQLRPSLLDVFPAALLGRMTVTPFAPLHTKDMQAIINIQLNKITKRLANKSIEFTYDEKATSLIAQQCLDIESGGRMIESILSQKVLPELSDKVLQAQLEEKELSGIHFSAKDDEFEYIYK